MSGKINAQTVEKSNKDAMAIVTGDTSKSSKIRALAAMQLDRSTIAQLLTNHYGKEVKYQFVRNVLVTKAPEPKKEVAKPVVATAEHFA